MFLNAGWIGGTLYLAMVLLTLGLGLRQVVRDRGGKGLSVVLVATFIGVAFEGVVIDTDHWRHFYLLMAMIWGMALAAPYQRQIASPPVYKPAAVSPAACLIRRTIKSSSTAPSVAAMMAARMPPPR